MTLNSFTNFLALQEVLRDQQLYETRIENDGDGQPIYIGNCITPNGDEDALIWYIIKLSYTGGYITRQQLPDNGIGFLYAWSQRASYFS